MTYETKLGHYSKIIWHGTFVFLVYENGEMKKYLTYQYSVYAGRQCATNILF